MRKIPEKYIEKEFWGNILMLILALMVLLGETGKLIEFSQGVRVVVDDWRFGKLGGLAAFGYVGGYVLMSLGLGAYASRGLVLWRRKHITNRSR